LEALLLLSSSFHCAAEVASREYQDTGLTWCEEVAVPWGLMHVCVAWDEAVLFGHLATLSSSHLEKYSVDRFLHPQHLLHKKKKKKKINIKKSRYLQGAQTQAQTHRQRHILETHRETLRETNTETHRQTHGETNRESHKETLAAWVLFR